MVNIFLSGAILLGWIVAAVFFLRFWSKSRDRFFAIFAAAFGLFAFERVLIVLTDPTHEFRPFIYLVRLLGFLLILAAIVEKNHAQRA